MFSVLLARKVYNFKLLSYLDEELDVQVGTLGVSLLSGLDATASFQINTL